MPNTEDQAVTKGTEQGSWIMHVDDAGWHLQLLDHEGTPLLTTEAYVDEAAASVAMGLIARTPAVPMDLVDERSGA